VIIGANKPQGWVVGIPLRGRVVNVLDGDTLDYEVFSCEETWHGTIRVRLAGIDAPEMKGPDVAKARRAQSRLIGMVLGRDCVLIPCRRWCDCYGRLIGHVFVGNKSCGLELLAQGLARAYHKTLVK